MAWTWQSAGNGTLKGSINGTTNTISLKGISANAITTAPQNTVDLANIILNIGGKTMYVDSLLEYTSKEGAVEQ